MSKEWNLNFIKEMDTLKQMIRKHNLKGEYLPRFILTPTFYEEYFNYQEKLLKNVPGVNPFLKYSNYQEYRIIKLLDNLNTAKNKFKKHTHAKNDEKRNMMETDDYEFDYKNRDSTSQLIRVNNIIKNSFELTTLIYLLEWLHSIYSKDDVTRESLRQALFFENTKRKVNATRNSFHPDMMNYNNNIVDREELEKFSRLLETILIHVRRGKLNEAQKIAEYNNQHFLSEMLNGGMPMNDFLLNKVETFNEIDFDLFPPFMKTKDFKEIELKIKKFQSSPNELYNNVDNIFDKVVGNPNWLLWFYSVHEGCNINLSPDGQPFNWQIKLLQTFLSGNSSYIETNEYSVHDLLYTYVLSLLNFRIIQEYQSNNKTIDYHFVETEPDFTKNFKDINGRNLIDIINIIKASEKYQDSVKKDFTLEIELELIQLHLIDHISELSQADGDIIYYEKLNELFLKAINTFHENEDFDAYVATHHSLIDRSSLPKENKFTKNEQQERANANILLIKLNYIKLIFMTLITYNSTNFDRLRLRDVDYKHNERKINLMMEILTNFDFIVSQFFTMLSLLTKNSINLVYTLSFAYDLQTIQVNLSNLAKTLDNEASYKDLISEIDEYFEGFEEQLKTSIASNTNIYDMQPMISSIDELLDREIKKPYEISKEDQNKINQVKCLFSEEKLDKYTILKYILKLSLKFLSKHKFRAATELSRNFNSIFNIDSILEKSLIQKENLWDPQNFVFFIEKFSFHENQTSLDNEYDISDLGIYFTILLDKIILDCYFNYLKLKQIVFNEIDIRKLGVSSDSKPIPISSFTKSNLNKYYKDVTTNFKQIIKLIRVIVINDDLREILINFFGEEVFIQDIRVILSNWIYQVLKWSVDIHTQAEFKIANFVNDERR